MGVVNVTPDSFSDGGRWFDTTAAVKHGLDLVAQGADLVDVGGESTRPGAPRVDEEEELRRVIPVVAAWPPRASRQRRHHARQVAERAVAAGALLVNDVSGGLADPGMVPAVAAADALRRDALARPQRRHEQPRGLRRRRPRGAAELRTRIDASSPAASPPSGSSSTPASVSQAPSTTWPSSPTLTAADLGCPAARCRFAQTFPGPGPGRRRRRRPAARQRARRRRPPRLPRSPRAGRLGGPGARGAGQRRRGAGGLAPSNGPRRGYPENAARSGER